MEANENDVFSVEKQVAIIEGIFDVFEKNDANIFESYRTTMIVQNALRPKMTELLGDIEDVLDSLTGDLEALRKSIEEIGVSE